MNKQIEQLLIKKELGICTDEELALLEQWYAGLETTGSRAVPGNEAEEKQFKESLLQSIHEKIDAAPREAPLRAARTRRSYWPAAAAAVALLVIGMGLLYHYRQKNTVQWVTVHVPAGKMQHLVFADSSEAWINGGSALKYPAGFKQGRDLYLEEGEAYFKVVHHEDKPFTVHTAGITTRDVGTAFAVRAYRDMPAVQITVEEGSVAVSAGSKAYGNIKPDQQLVVDKQTRQGFVREVPARYITAWKQDRMELNNITFAHLALVLENAYNVDIVFKNEKLKSCVFTISFDRSLSAVQVLDVINALHPIRYRVDKNKNQIIINGKGCDE